MRTVATLVLLVILGMATTAIAQDTTWWIVIVTGVAIEGRNVTFFVGPYPNLTMCNAQVTEARKSLGPETPIQSTGCRSNVEVAGWS